MRVLTHLVTIALVVLAPSVAFADDIVSSEDSCRNAEVGKACQFDGGSGTCQTTECRRMDYSVEPPKERVESCLDCLRGAPPKAEPTPAKAEPSKAPTTPAKAEPSKAPTTTVTPATTKAEPAKAADSKSTGSSTSTCSVAPDTTFAASLGLGALLLLVARRRGRP